jgi:hypothetical protein
MVTSPLSAAAERWASGAADSRSDAGAEAIGGRLHAGVRLGSDQRAWSENAGFSTSASACPPSGATETEQPTDEKGFGPMFIAVCQPQLR